MLLNPEFVDYKILRNRDMPEIELVEVPTYEPNGPFGAKEAAEAVIAPTGPALANAVFAATGAEFFGNVLKPETVLNAVRAAAAKKK
jgi:4-hydroxybenzoyl-CoA reductase subunit alpha